MKVCLVTNIYPPDSLGGPGEVVYNLQKFFLEHRIATYVFTCGSYDKKYPYTIRTRFGKRLFLPLSPLYYLRQIEKMHFDIVNIHSEGAMGITPFLFFREKPKVVTTLHTEHLTESKATRVLSINGLVIAKPSLDELITKNFLVPLKLVGTYANIAVSDRVVAVSEKTKNDYLQQHFISKEKISVIYNGVDSKKFNPEVSGDLIRRKYLIFDSPLMLSVSSGTVLKGVVFIFFALKEIIKFIPKIKLLVVGINANYMDQMILMINSLGISNNVILVSRIPNHEMPYFYASADIVVLSSLSENFPVVILEAMASGKPVIASRVGGIPEIIRDNKNGILVDPSNVDQLVTTVLYLIENPSQQIEIGLAGRKTIEEKFDWSKIGDKYLKLFEDLL